MKRRADRFILQYSYIPQAASSLRYDWLIGKLSYTASGIFASLRLAHSHCLCSLFFCLKSVDSLAHWHIGSFPSRMPAWPVPPTVVAEKVVALCYQLPVFCDKVPELCFRLPLVCDKVVAFCHILPLVCDELVAFYRKLPLVCDGLVALYHKLPLVCDKVVALCYQVPVVYDGLRVLSSRLRVVFRAIRVCSMNCVRKGRLLLVFRSCFFKDRSASEEILFLPAKIIILNLKKQICGFANDIVYRPKRAYNSNCWFMM